MKGFIKRNFQIKSQVGTARRPTLATTKGVAKKAFKNIRKIAEASATLTATHAAIFKGRFAVPVISGTLLRIFQDVIGFANRLELRFGFVTARIAVGMAFHREPPIGRLQRFFIRRPLNLQQFIIINIETHS